MSIAWSPIFSLFGVSLWLAYLFLGPVVVGKWPQQEVCMTDTGCSGLLKEIFTGSNQKVGSGCQLTLDLDF